ncbi:unnamed protein product [Cyprideis torosa]|uniref:CAAX prenyl protease 2 n=1 Tax=Cyprideis torosa TaxID=163714 RepID=A0A7R8ZFV4_9CRUS|nr:unnamed protein product [Cyprideis torosa]CAG0879979.1 unnamed protein product [Cyprideis torosa]
MVHALVPVLSPWASFLYSVLLSVFSVSCLYIWGNEFSRDHPIVIKRRFLSITIACVLAFALVWFLLSHLAFVEIGSLLGFRSAGFCPAVVLPVLLTVVLSTGPLYMKHLDGSLRWSLSWDCFRRSVVDLTWWRNIIVAPLSEEFIYRSAIVPVLKHGAFSDRTVVFLSPLMFGVAHFHHMIENLRLGMPLMNAIFLSSFQFFYTSIFGAYSTFLFLRTGHFVAPFLVHAFCNALGVPNLEVINRIPDDGLRRRIWTIFVAGLVAFIVLVIPLTDPSIYENALYWTS